MANTVPWTGHSKVAERTSRSEPIAGSTLAGWHTTFVGSVRKHASTTTEEDVSSVP